MGIIQALGLAFWLLITCITALASVKKYFNEDSLINLLGASAGMVSLIYVTMLVVYYNIVEISKEEPW